MIVAHSSEVYSNGASTETSARANAKSVRVYQTEIVFAFALDPVHRLVGRTNQLLRGHAMLRVQRNTDTGAYRDLGASHL